MTDPDGAKWEWYVKTGDTDQLTNQILTPGESATCCAPSSSAGTCHRRTSPRHAGRLLLSPALWPRVMPGTAR